MEHSSSCDDIKPLLSSYFDNELDGDDYKIVINHLNICSSCNKELENIKNLSRLLKESYHKILQNDNNITQNVMDRINTQKDITCNEVLEELSAYFDGEAPLKLHYLIKEHMENCPDCNKELINLEKLSSNIKAVLNEDKNIDLWSNIEPYLDDINTCREICEKLSPFLDKELAKNEMSEISGHLLVCQYCRRDYENLKLVQQAVRGYLLKPQAGNSDLLVRAYSRLNRTQRQSELLRSSVALLMITLLSWFSVNSEPILVQDRYPTVKISYAKTYLRSEDFLFNKVYSVPTEGVMPEND